MSILFRQDQAAAERVFGPTAAEQIPARPPAGSIATGAVHVDGETALRHSAVWAALRIRANMISSLPCDVYRTVGGLQLEVPKPPVLDSPDGEMDLPDWLWATQFDLDRFGNVFGLITARDGLGFPARIELVPTVEVAVRSRGSRVQYYRVGNERFEPGEIWHERQYRLAGFPVGLNVVAKAATSIGNYLSAQKFAADFYAAGGAPSGVLKNTEMEIPDPADIDSAKAQFKASTWNRDIFVTGRDWEWTPASSEAAAAAYIDEMKWGVADVARYFDVPGDIIDAAMSGSSVTYANIGQRQTALLVNHLGPAVGRRERALSRLTPKPRAVKLNSDALLRMDPETRARVLLAQVAGRTLTPSEARLIDDRPPFTPADLAEFEALGFTKSVPTSSPGAGSPVEVPA